MWLPRDYNGGTGNTVVRKADACLLGTRGTFHNEGTHLHFVNEPFSMTTQTESV